MIVGGSTDKDSSQAQKTHGRRLKSYEIDTKSLTKISPSINFETQDLEGIATPHGDALVIQVVICNYNVEHLHRHRELGEHAFKKIFDQMQIDRHEL